MALEPQEQIAKLMALRGVTLATQVGDSSVILARPIFAAAQMGSR
jgi:hypothetical protein